ncbi:MAG: thioredoxin family protein [Planctomycetaceae bacterium]|nr:thioredoxin family protein [Planctomycetaceae bacterium]
MMKNLWKLIVVVILAAAVIAVVVLKNKEKQSEPVSIVGTNQQPVAEPNQSVIPESNQPAVAVKLPKLIDLGADKCIPCKMMKPVLDELTVEYKGKLDVIFYDVWKAPAYGEKYHIEIIPTQIFFDPNEKELFRHQGFFSKEEILAKWKELGFEIK